MARNQKPGLRKAVICRMQQRHERMFQTVVAGFNAPNDGRVQRCLEAMLGSEGSINCLLGSNALERANFARRLGAKACELAAAAGYEMVVLDTIDRSWMFDRHASVLDLPLIRRVNNQLKKIGSSSVSVVRIGCVPVEGGGFAYCPVLRSAVFFNGAKAQLDAAVAGLRRKFQCPLSVAGESVELWSFPAQSPQTWFTEIANLFSMSDPLRPRLTASVELDELRDWKAAGKARTLERFQVLTMCTLDKLVMATGELAPILDGALREAASRARKLYSAGDKPLHRDQIPHFWFEQQLQLKRQFVPPFVKLR